MTDFSKDGQFFTKGMGDILEAILSGGFSVRPVASGDTLLDGIAEEMVGAQQPCTCPFCMLGGQRRVTLLIILTPAPAPNPSDLPPWLRFKG